MYAELSENRMFANIKFNEKKATQKKDSSLGYKRLLLTYNVFMNIEPNKTENGRMKY